MQTNMFCENCGNKTGLNYKFCDKCGHLNVHSEERKVSAEQSTVVINDKWWQRLLKVLYIISYLPLLILIPLVWSENSHSYYYGDTPGNAFWYSLLTLVIYVAIVRLLKVTVLYVAVGQAPKWKSEFKKLF